ncbi:MAG: hypothetical protein WAN66_04020 [Limnoraphis robusta]
MMKPLQKHNSFLMKPKNSPSKELFHAREIYQEISDSSDFNNFTARQAEAKLLSVTASYWWSDNQKKALEFHNQALKIYQ